MSYYKWLIFAEEYTYIKRGKKYNKKVNMLIYEYKVEKSFKETQVVPKDWNQCSLILCLNQLIDDLIS